MQPKLNLPPRGQYYSHAATPTLILRSGYCMIRQWTCQQIHSTEWGGGGGGGGGGGDVFSPCVEFTLFFFCCCSF